MSRRQRIPIEGEFGQGKHGYRLGYIRADTSVAWINSIFLVMNLMVLLKYFHALWKPMVLDVLSRMLCFAQLRIECPTIHAYRAVLIENCT